MTAAAGDAGVAVAPRPGWFHRGVLLLGLAALILLAAPIPTGPGPSAAGATRPERRPALLLDGVAREADGRLVAVPAGTAATYLPGSRVLDPAATELAAADRAWLAAAPVPGAGTAHEELVADALLDLRALTLTNGAALAAYSPKWRYVWPRDASFVAAAFAVAGHPDDALRVLEHLQTLTLASGRFEARYLPDGSGSVPDDRAPQSDGAGWVLWATGALLAELPPDQARAAAVRLTPLVRSAHASITEETATRTGLPKSSGDYWEVGSRRLSLGTAAPLLSGLESLPAIYRALGEPARAALADEQARDLRRTVTWAFGWTGFPRYLGGRAGDAAVAFALPPFQPTALDGARGAWLRSIPKMTRPAGGLAPGVGWKSDGISWTPQTALYALAAASNGAPERAEGWLAWLAAHRTASGALPEKVLADGSPAAVAPLAWTCALVVLTVAALESDPIGPRVRAVRR